MAMTVGELKEWLKSLSPPTPELALPDGLPDALGDLKDAVNLGALSDWFTMGAALTEMVPDPDKLCVTGIIAKETPNLSLWFFSDDEANPDDAPVTGVQIGLSLKQHAVMSVLSALGLQDVLLVYEIRIMDGAAVRELYAQAALAAGGGDPLLITCSLDFAADRTSYEFAVEPEDGREWHVAEAFFGLFGVTPPPVLKDIALHRLVLAYDRGKDSTGFRIEVGAGFPLGDTTADLDVKATLSKSGDSGTYDQEYEGTLVLAVPAPGGGDDVRTLTFTVKDAQHAEFSASCEDSKGVSFTDVATLLGVAEPPAFLAGPTVSGLTVGYASARKSIVFAAKENGGGSLVVVSDQPAGGTRAWAMRAGVGLDAKLSDVPLLHGQIPEGQDLGVCGLGILLTSDPLDTARVSELNKALAASDGSLPLLPADGLGKGLAFTVDLQLPGHSETTSVVVRGDSKKSRAAAPAPATAPALATAVATDTAAAPAGLPLVAWIKVQRNVGPLNLSRVGVGFADDTVWVLFDATLGMAGLTIGVDGLGMGIRLSDPVPPEFRLDGLSVGYSRPPLAIKGSLVNRASDDYDPLIEGALAVSAEEFGLTALGAYARPTAHPDQPSFFLFGKVNGEFGGPPPVQVTGIMAGFGLNTDLRLPEGDEVLDFPFLADMSSPETDPLKVLGNLMGGQDAWVRSASGQLWFAAGLEFKVFEFLDGQALLVLEVGDDFAVAVLGTAEARFPKDQSLPAYARVRLGLSAKYRASEGVLKLTAQLAPGSFLLDEACVLTGGFALYTWFDGPNAGDFVLTLGGYYPGYPVPAYYPQVPRLGFNWPVTPELTISGGSYFALTPGAIMAGGALDVNFRSGDLHAWLTAHAHILIEWAPFHFDAGIDVSIGVSYVLDLWLVRETISVEVGASLHLWGPPTGGEVTVHLWFISFTIGFGEGSASGDKAASWSEVVKQLPSAQDAVRLVPMDGLIPVESKDEPGLWTVGTGDFSFAVRTAVPIGKLYLGDQQHAVDGTDVDIRPLRDGGEALDSTLTVTLTRESAAQDLSAWAATPNVVSLPAALWGKYDGKLTTGSAQRVDHQLTGVDLRLPQPTQGSTPGPIKAGTIAHDDRTPNGRLPLVRPAAVRAAAAAESAPVQAEAPQPVTVELVAEAAPVAEVRASVGAVTSGQAGALVDQSRDRLFAAMDYLGVSPGPGTNERLTATDGLVAGDVTVQPAPPVPGRPAASERLYVLGAGATVTPVDAQSLTVYEPIALANPGPAYFAVSPDGSRLTTASPGREHFDAFDITANPPGKAVGLKPAPFSVPTNAKGVAFAPDHAWAYVTYAQPDQMLILGFQGDTPASGHTYGILTADWRSAEPADVVTALPWDQSVYIALPKEDCVMKVDVSSLANPTAKAYLPAGPSPTRLAADPKGRWVYALNTGRSTVTVIDVTAKAIAATLRTGTAPSALAASADGKRLYVANAVTGTVSVFDTSGDLPREAAEPVWVGARPVALAVSAAGDRLYVARSKGPENGEVAPLHVVDVVSDPPVLLPVTVPLKDEPVALAVTVPPTVTGTPAVPSITRITEGGAA
ncbi:YncE family protein [Streptomyces sp. AA8]|uniref:YncE family protein n=4 Tax=Streptomyces telluris TaxID=2720021 RepID=A0A9X2LHK8_9ACTN|nr:YncE family protein [Streptomyces telluris]